MLGLRIVIGTIGFMFVWISVFELVDWWHFDFRSTKKIMRIWSWTKLTCNVIAIAGLILFLGIVKRWWW